MPKTVRGFKIVITPLTSMSRVLCVLTIETVYVQDSVGSLAIGGPLQQTGRVRPDVLLPDVQPLQGLKQTVLAHTVIALWPIVRHKPTTKTTITTKSMSKDTNREIFVQRLLKTYAQGHEDAGKLLSLLLY